MSVAVKKPIPFGKYLLLDRINVGGMAEVFKAKAYGIEEFERLVAIQADFTQHRRRPRLHHDVYR